MNTINQQILSILKASLDYVSGQSLSQVTGVTRSGVWKHIQVLRSQGYDIHGLSNRGYRLVSNADFLTDIEIQEGLSTKTLGHQIYSFEEISSTMDEAFHLAEQNAREGVMVVAESQTKGRGRLGRIWESLKYQGIYCSVILRPQCSLQHVPSLTLVGAVAVSEAIESLTGIRSFIKWPNDLLIDNKKLAGILTEIRADLDTVDYVILGIGMNVNHSKEQLLKEAISLKSVLRTPVSRIALLQEVLKKLECRYHQFQKGQLHLILKEWKTRTATLGKTIAFKDVHRQNKGVAIDIDSNGALLVELPNGSIRRLFAGDIRHG